MDKGPFAERKGGFSEGTRTAVLRWHWGPACNLRGHYSSACDPSTWEAEATGPPGVQGQLELHSEFQTSYKMRPHPKTDKNKPSNQHEAQHLKITAKSKGSFERVVACPAPRGAVCRRG